MKRIIFATVMGAMFLGLCGTALAGSGAGAINLSFPIGARYNGLGEAGTALSQDVTAIWWNPGGLGFLPQRPKQHDVHIMQSSLAEGLADDIGLYWGGYATPMGEHGALGFAMNYLDMGEQVGTDEESNETGTFRSYMFSFSATYGVQVSRNLGVGLGVKYFRDHLADDQFLQDKQGGSGDSFGVDLGLLWKVPSIRSNIGLAIANLGPDIVHVDGDQSDPMPRKATLGVAFSVYHSEFMGILLVSDYLVPLYKWSDSDNDYGFGLDTGQKEYGAGVEWNYMRSLFVRLGYKSAQYGDIEDTTFGFGVDMEQWSGQAITFDFATVPQAEGLPKVNRLSLSYRF